MEQDKVTFKGRDWTELGSILGLDDDMLVIDELALKKFQEIIIKASLAHCGEGDVHIANYVRQFLLALEKNEHKNIIYPLFYGLRHIEHDGMMLNLVAHNLHYLRIQS